MTTNASPNREVVFFVVVVVTSRKSERAFLAGTPATAFPHSLPSKQDGGRRRRRIHPSGSAYHLPLGAEEGVALERLVAVGGDEGEDAVVGGVGRAVGDPERRGPKQRAPSIMRPPFQSLFRPRRYAELWAVKNGSLARVSNRRKNVQRPGGGRQRRLQLMFSTGSTKSGNYFSMVSFRARRRPRAKRSQDRKEDTVSSACMVLHTGFSSCSSRNFLLLQTIDGREAPQLLCIPTHL